jgi:hypothetical protein
MRINLQFFKHITLAFVVCQAVFISKVHAQNYTLDFERITKNSITGPQTFASSMIMDMAITSGNEHYVLGFANEQTDLDYSSQSVLVGTSGPQYFIARYNSDGNFVNAKVFGNGLPQSQFFKLLVNEASGEVTIMYWTNTVQTIQIGVSNPGDAPSPLQVSTNGLVVMRLDANLNNHWHRTFSNGALQVNDAILDNNELHIVGRFANLLDPGSGLTPVTSSNGNTNGFWLTLSSIGNSTSFITSPSGTSTNEYTSIAASSTHFVLGVDFTQSFTFNGTNYASVIGSTPTSFALAISKSNGQVTGFRNFSLGNASRSHIANIQTRPNGEIYILLKHFGTVYPFHNGLNNQGVVITQSLSGGNYALIKYSNHLQNYVGNLPINENRRVTFSLDASTSTDVFVAVQSNTSSLNVGSGSPVTFTTPTSTQAAAIARYSSNLGASSYVMHIPQFVANEFPGNLNFANYKFKVNGTKIYSFSYLITSHHAPHVALISYLKDVSTNQIVYSDNAYAQASTLARYGMCEGTAPSITASETTVCGGGQVTLTSTSPLPGYTTLFWQSGSCPSTPTSIQGNSHQTFVPANGVPQQWFARLLGACPSSSCASITVTGQPNLVAGTISGNAQVCQAIGQSVNYSVSGFNAPGVWSSSNPSVLGFDFASGNSGFFIVNGTGNTVIRYIVSNSSGCPADTATFSVQVSQPTVLGPISGPNTLCVGEEGLYTHPVDGGTWSSFNSGIVSVNSTSGQAIANTAGSVSIQYVIPAINGCPAASISLPINAVSNPVVGSVISGNSELCVGSSSSYQVNPSGAPASISWTLNNSLATITPSGVLTANAPGMTTITYTATNAQGCSSVLQLNVQLSENPQAGNIISSSSTLCPNGVLQLTTSGDSGGVWSSSNTSFATVDPVTGLVTSTGIGSTIITYAHPASGGCAGSQTTFTLSDGLNGQAPLTAVTLPNSAAVCPGAAYFISSTITGGTGLSYQWSLNGVPIAGANQADLFLPSVSTSNFGNYTLEVSSACSTLVSNTFQLSEITPGSIQTQPQANTVVCENPGGSIELQIAVTGNPIAIEWTYFGVPTGGTGTTLTIPALPENSGNYVAVVNYECATLFSNFAQVTINPTPVIGNQPVTQTICDLGEHVEFSVSTNFAQSFEWQNSAGQTVGTDENLVLTNVTMAEVNEMYQLTATNSCGSMVSQQVGIELIGVPIYQSSGIGSISVCEGESVQLEVDFSVNGNLVTQGIQWFVDGALLPHDTQILQIQADASTQGVYTAVFQNSCGQVQSDNIDLIVYETAQTTETFWLCEGDTISVNGIEYFEEGTYFYSLQSQFGCDSLAQVDVYFFSKDNPVIVSNGNMLECTISNASFYQWYLNGTAISGANSSSYLAEESGIYHVEIISSSGCVEYSNELNYQTAGISEDKIALVLYPNPSQGGITIESGVALSGYLTDLSGRKIQDITIETGANVFQFNLAPGVYSLNLGNRVLPLVIQ